MLRSLWWSVSFSHCMHTRWNIGFIFLISQLHWKILLETSHWMWLLVLNLLLCVSLSPVCYNYIVCSCHKQTCLWSWCKFCEWTHISSLSVGSCTNVHIVCCGMLVFKCDVFFKEVCSDAVTLLYFLGSGMIFSVICTSVS